MSRCGCRRRGTPRLRRLPAPAFGDEAPCRRGRGCRRVRRDRRACAGVRPPSPCALPGGGLPGGWRPPPCWPCRRSIGAAQNEVRSTWALTPSGLSDGDKFRLIFITSTRRTANATSSDIERLQHLRAGARCGGAHADPALQLAVPGGGVHRRDRCPRQHGHHRDRGADLLAERQQGRRQLRGLLQRQLGRRGESEEPVGNE